MAEKIIVASGKGGVGKTSLTAGLAMALAAKGEKVLVVDFDIGQGSAAFMLGAESEPVFNWGDALKNACENEDTLCKAGNVSYICAPTKWDDTFSDEKIKNFISFFNSDFSYILFDAPAGVLGGFGLAAQCADRALIVSTPDEVCVRAAKGAARELRKKKVDKIRLIINRFDKNPTVKGKYLNIDEVINAVGVQLIGVVPEDKNISYCASTGFANLKDCPAKAAFGRVADRVRGKRVRLVLQNTKKEKPKSKAPIAAVLSVIGAIIILLAGAFLTDFYMSRNLKEPIFVKEVVSDGGGATLYRGFCYTVETNKNTDGTLISCKMQAFGKTIGASVS